MVNPIYIHGKLLMSNLSCIYRWSIILILKNQRKLCYSQRYLSNLKVQLCSSRHLFCIINAIVIAKYIVFKYNSLNNVLLINYIVYMNINSLAYINCCIFFVNPPYKYGYFYHFMFSTVST